MPESKDTISNFSNLIGKEGVKIDVKLDKFDILLLLSGILGAIVIGGLIVVFIYKGSK